MQGHKNLMEDVPDEKLKDIGLNNE